MLILTHCNVWMWNAAPFPMMVLALDWTIDDLVRFCTNGDEFCLGVWSNLQLGIIWRHCYHVLASSKASSNDWPPFHPRQDGLSFICLLVDVLIWRIYIVLELMKKQHRSMHFQLYFHALFIKIVFVIFAAILKWSSDNSTFVLNEIVYDVLGNTSGLNESEFDSILTGFQNSFSISHLSFMLVSWRTAVLQ